MNAGQGSLVDALGFPTSSHPENLSDELPSEQEEWLASAATELWPEDEYVWLIRDGGTP